tara:strand:- start:633 stop:746 length:114 start_codon:yes stop_codon:yes gene_type:complete
MLERGGGGHEAVGTCQILKSNAEKALVELVAAINQAG